MYFFANVYRVSVMCFDSTSVDHAATNTAMESFSVRVSRWWWSCSSSDLRPKKNACDSLMVPDETADRCDQNKESYVRWGGRIVSTSHADRTGSQNFFREKKLTAALAETFW